MAFTNPPGKGADGFWLPPPGFDDEAAHKEQRSKCLHGCLQTFKEQDRKLFLLYYLKKTNALDEYRLWLAAKFGLTISGLRVKMMRLRDRMRFCVNSCQQNAGG